MINQDSSMEGRLENLFIQFFKSNPALSQFPPNHYSEDDEAETPDIVVKAAEKKKYTEHATIASQRLYTVEMEFKIRANIGKVTVEGFDSACAILEDMIDNISAYAPAIQALPALAFFNLIQTIDEDGSGMERDDDEKRRRRCRKIVLLVQEKA